MQQSSASSAFSPRALELPLLDPQVARRESLDAGVLAVERLFSQGVEKDCEEVAEDDDDPGQEKD